MNVVRLIVGFAIFLTFWIWLCQPLIGPDYYPKEMDKIEAP